MSSSLLLVVGVNCHILWYLWYFVWLLCLFYLSFFSANFINNTTTCNLTSSIRYVLLTDRGMVNIWYGFNWYVHDLDLTALLWGWEETRYFLINMNILCSYHIEKDVLLFLNNRNYPSFLSKKRTKDV